MIKDVSSENFKVVNGKIAPKNVLADLGTGKLHPAIEADMAEFFSKTYSKGQHAARISEVSAEATYNVAMPEGFQSQVIPAELMQ